jgi:hypothetical protein
LRGELDEETDYATLGSLVLEYALGLWYAVGRLTGSDAFPFLGALVALKLMHRASW